VETYLVAGRSGAAKSFPAERTYLSAYVPPARFIACFEKGGSCYGRPPDQAIRHLISDPAVDGDVAKCDVDSKAGQKPGDWAIYFFPVANDAPAMAKSVKGHHR